ncbi:hypothetical protein GTA08_BOTSDO13664 [Botryosphaeria dothidea]|uniref:Ankyrin repeat protein n=1 Tax=Botryosphaeria dothidea TaxID=55169 RepID=A0A8H4N6G6_9PEZI|nr:hypothetical protein GTA08_BOTSDO13664 [Botryosphaeria dothidea]
MEWRTSLHLAVDNSSFDIVTSLLKGLLEGLSVEVYTILFDEADYREDDRGVSTDRVLDTVDKSGKTALHYAAEGGELKTVKSLVHCGATLDKVDKTGRIPREYANQKKDIYEFLKTEQPAQGINHDLGLEDFQDDNDLFEEK